MMSERYIKLTSPQCGQHLEVPTETALADVQCPTCSAAVPMPRRGQPAQSLPDARTGPTAARQDGQQLGHVAFAQELEGQTATCRTVGK